MKKLVITRRISQVFFFLLFVYILWSTTYPLKGIISPELIFKIDPLVVFFTSLAERIFLPGMGLALGMLVLTLILGRFFCGWVCPLGTMIDWTAALKKEKLRLNDQQNRRTRRFKFYVLGTVAVFALFGVQVAWVFDPLVMAARFVSMNFIPSFTLGVNKLFQFLVQTFNLYGPVYDFYRGLRSSILGVEAYTFENSGLILSVFIIVVLSAYFLQRLWCRMFCPLGAIYCLTAKPSLLERRVGDCSQCQICVNHCRMGAIKKDTSYVKGECILCMDCVYNCPQQGTQFRFRKMSESLKLSSLPTGKAGNDRSGISRGDFLILLASAISALGFRHRFGREVSKGPLPSRNVIRPPGALKEDEFVDRCIRCGNCMKVCITNGLQPVSLESGAEGIWTPQLVPEIGACEYNCTLCGNVCPTGAIPKLPLEVKQKTKLGRARIDKSICLAWAEKKECIVCEEHCPVPDKAIELKKEWVDGRLVLKPVVDHKRCIGCGLCQNVCPVRPMRAIRVTPS